MISNSPLNKSLQQECNEIGHHGGCGEQCYLFFLNICDDDNWTPGIYQNHKNNSAQNYDRAMKRVL